MPVLLYTAYPATERIAKLLKHLVERYSSFSYEQLFKPDEIDELHS
jgi:hypothetical protein